VGTFSKKPAFVGKLKQLRFSVGTLEAKRFCVGNIKTHLPTKPTYPQKQVSLKKYPEMSEKGLGLPIYEIKPYIN